jgi:hypothetical protein
MENTRRIVTGHGRNAYFMEEEYVEPFLPKLPQTPGMEREDFRDEHEYRTHRQFEVGA